MSKTTVTCQYCGTEFEAEKKAMATTKVIACARGDCQEAKKATLIKKRHEYMRKYELKRRSPHPEYIEKPCSICGDPVAIRWNYAKQTKYSHCKDPACIKQYQRQSVRRYQKRLKAIEPLESQSIYTDKPCRECGGRVEIENYKGAACFPAFCETCRGKKEAKSRQFADGYVYHDHAETLILLSKHLTRKQEVGNEKICSVDMVQ